MEFHLLKPKTNEFEKISRMKTQIDEKFTRLLSSLHLINHVILWFEKFKTLA